ncbi:MAG: hypothetical protein ACREN8_07895 [Candidatus Dormibacteraceae bacterium]
MTGYLDWECFVSLGESDMPERDSDHMNTVGEPCEGKPHAWFDEGRLGELNRTSRLLYRNP